MAYDENSKQSLFNAGVAQAERIDSLQRAINAARYNPMDINIETKTFNYQIILSSLNGLLMESWSKLTTTEKKEIRRTRELIDKYIKNYPPISMANSVRDGNEYQWNLDNYDRLLTLLKIYETQIKDVLDAHSLNSPDKEDDDGL